MTLKLRTHLGDWARLGLVAGVLLNLGSALGGNDIDLPKLAKESRPAVVLLLVYGQDDELLRTGSGFFISADGKLVTNAHVIADADRILAKFENEDIVAVPRVITSDKEVDIAVLQADINQQPFLTLGDSRLTEVGERIAVVGSPLGLDGTLSEGIISAKRNARSEHKWLQITAPLSPGSSGSPVLNSRGEVIGVATMVISGGQALNFAIPIGAPKQAKPRTSSETEDSHSRQSPEQPDGLTAEVLKDLQAQDYTSPPLAAEELAKQNTELGHAVRHELQKGNGSSPVYKAYLMGFWRQPSKPHP